MNKLIHTNTHTHTHTHSHVFTHIHERFLYLLPIRQWRLNHSSTHSLTMLCLLKKFCPTPIVKWVPFLVLLLHNLLHYYAACKTTFATTHTFQNNNNCCYYFQFYCISKESKTTSFVVHRLVLPKIVIGRRVPTISTQGYIDRHNGKYATHSYIETCVYTHTYTKYIQTCTHTHTHIHTHIHTRVLRGI